MASKLDTKQGARELLSRVKVSPSQARGQNFLHDPAAVREVLNFAAIKAGELLLEIGPGLGALTEHLASISPTLRVVEIEGEFAERLRKTLPASATVIEGDILNLSLSEITQIPLTLISNVPYSISTELSLWLFKNCSLVKRASLLLQREFAERLAAAPHTRAYGSLTVLRARYCQAELGPIIGPEAFHPRPKVESRLIALDFRAPEIRLDGVSEERFEEFVRTAFRQKRKTLINNLWNSSFFSSKEEVRDFLARNSLSETARAEEISPERFVELVKLLPGKVVGG
jgi:16S rRNA (adenine1518-N6/adenine1519-N6)-dimethyltransferase